MARCGATLAERHQLTRAAKTSGSLEVIFVQVIRARESISRALIPFVWVFADAVVGGYWRSSLRLQCLWDYKGSKGCP